MGVVNYYGTNGEIYGDSQAGDYMRDALGSVTATSSPSTGSVQNTYRYKPYGSQLSTSGGSPTPKFQWVGTAGYRQTSISHSTTYVRARHYALEEGRWTTVDPLWPREQIYGYSGGSPTTRTDRSGRSIDFIGCGGKPMLTNCCKGLKSPKYDRKKVKECMKGLKDSSHTDADVDFFLGIIERFCSEKVGKGGENNACVRCGSPGGIPQWNPACGNPCRLGAWGWTWPDPEIVVQDGVGRQARCGLELILPVSGIIETYPCPSAHKGTNGKPCNCSIVICQSIFGSKEHDPCALLFHELAHCSGLGHKGGQLEGEGIHISRNQGFIYRLGCCICRVTQDDCGDECNRIWSPK